MTIVAHFDKCQGLSNRIKNIVSCFRISDDVEVLWNSEVLRFFNQYDISILDYFPNLKLTDSIDGKKSRNGWRLEVFDNDLPKDFKEDHYLSKTTCSSNGMGIDFEYHRIPKSVRDSYIKCFNKLQLNPKIIEKVDEFSNSHFDKNTVSIHVRTWIDCGQRRREFYKIENFFHLMDKYENEMFFISTDDHNVISEFQNRYGKNRIIFYPYPEEYIGIVDQLLLSRNSEFISSPCSTFSEVAWWFSNCKSNVKVAWNFKK